MAYLLGIPNNKIKRICFHEITKDAILHALENPRKIDQNLVDAQQARRVLDRLVGYELSPFLWKKVYYGLSAGRVQSVAVRLIVERELEREQFKKEEYWSISSDFNTIKKESITAELNKINNKKLDKFDIKNEKEANDIKNDLEKLDFKVSNIDERNSKKSVPTPFTTS
ncbi:MAG: DNA topoisomerase, partial [Patescibacteria group bacterium]